MLAWVYSDVDPGRAFLYDRKLAKATYLLSARPWIDPARMAKMKPIRFKARDGVVINGYLTLPAGSAGKNVPMIVNPHGGPHGPRDEWRFNPEVQYFASRGYAEYLPLFQGAAPAAVAAGGNSCTEPAAGDQPGCRTTLETAILAGGCFWGMEDILRKIPGVLETEAGYTGDWNWTIIE